MKKLKPKPPKRGAYKPKTVVCSECAGVGYFWTRAYPSSRCVPHKEKCRQCNGKGSHVPPTVTHAANCTGCGGIYKCFGCHRWVGWCSGALDDMPEHCDDCWSKAHPAPKRRESLPISEVKGG